VSENTTKRMYILHYIAVSVLMFVDGCNRKFYSTVCFFILYTIERKLRACQVTQQTKWIC